MVRAHWNGAVIAESDDTVFIDGNHYFPADSVDEQYLVPSDTTTVCSWKGRASYYSVEVDGQLNRDAAWFHPTPLPAAEKIQGHVAFHHGVQVDDAVVSPPRRSFLDRFRRRPGGAGHTAVDTPAVVADLDDASFRDALGNNVTIIDFWAPWCGPCRQLHPMFDARAADHTGTDVQFARVNVDENPATASTYAVMSIPTIIVVDADGQEIAREVGLPSKRRLDQLVHHAGSVAGTITGGTAQ